MKRFAIGQKWVMADRVYCQFFGEVIEISDEGRSGTVVITDDRDDIVDTFTGSAGEFQASGEWQLAD